MRTRWTIIFWEGNRDGWLQHAADGKNFCRNARHVCNSFSSDKFHEVVLFHLCRYCCAISSSCLSVCVTMCLLLPFGIHAKFSSSFECPCTKQLMMAQFQLANTQKLLCETIRSAFIFQRESAERINRRKKSMTWEGRRTGNERQICCV